ncbi:hypothetical protein DYB32_006201 [Aphanomyces invadans]|uniref:Gem-associated protein 5 TPR domain-containing protein n=1 Tax=Aphanomyces invadans TaxID=157072 RepID=A0A418ASK2_9STRA|nr:hypothetical protein DYB32_006201 [Aphanomyces invadans]
MLHRRRRYCQLLVEVDDWEAALAMAPAVSLAYWRELASKYADVLQAKEDEAAFAYYLATQQLPKAVQVLQSRGQFNDACVVAKAHTTLLCAPAAHEESVLPPSTLPRSSDACPNEILMDLDASEGKHQDKCSTATPPTSCHRSASKKENDMTNAARDVSTRRLLDTTYTWLADLYTSRGDPVLAACCHLAVAHVGDAIDRLVRGDEVRGRNGTNGVVVLVVLRKRV